MLPPAIPDAGPRLRDWALLLVSFGFTAAGAALWWSGRDPGPAMATTAFFGLCLAVAVGNVMEKRALRRFAAAERVEITGGVPIPMRRGRLLGLGVTLIAVGGMMVAGGGSFGVVYQAVASLLPLTGAILTGGVLLGRFGRDSLCFEPAGLRLAGRGWSMLVHWDNVGAVDVAEPSDNPEVRLVVRDADRLLGTLEATKDPVATRARLVRRLERTRTWQGCDWTILPVHFGLNAALLSKAIHGYAADPVSRARLTPRPPLPGASGAMLTAALAAALVAPAVADPGLPDADVSARLAERLAKIRSEHPVPALAAALVRGDRIVAAAAVGVRVEGREEPVRLDDRFHLGSCTKAMTATLAGILVERGRIAWETTIGERFPDLAESMRPEYRDVTLEQLLTHRSGLPDNDHLEAGVWATIWRLDGPIRERRRKAVELTLRQKPMAAPGEKMLYTNLGTMVAGAMLEAATERSWEELLRDEMFVPLGMTTAGFGPPGTAGADPPDAPWGHVAGRDGTPTGKSPGPGADNPAVIGPAGTVHASIEDFARFGRLHLAGARGVEGGLLPPALLQRMHEPPAGGTYAMGWGVAERPWGKGRVFTHAGSNTFWFAVIWVAPGIDAVFVAACNWAGPEGTRACDRAISTMIREFLE